jgi:signal transduction histidine kinase
MRTVLVELRPSALIEMDLGDLIEQLARAATARAPQLEVAVTQDGKQQLPPEVQVALYRVAQEALNNIARHSDAQHAQVHLARHSAGVELTISDDGRGFDDSSVAPGHLGLGIMRERVEAINGVLSIESRPAAGTRLHVVWADAMPQHD